MASDECDDAGMTRKKSLLDGHTREMLAEIEREMAKPRLAESVREAFEAEEAEPARVKLLRLPLGRRKSS